MVIYYKIRQKNTNFPSKKRSRSNQREKTDNRGWFALRTPRAAVMGHWQPKCRPSFRRLITAGGYVVACVIGTAVAIGSGEITEKLYQVLLYAFHAHLRFPVDLVWFRLSCDHGWIRSGSVNVRKQQQQQLSVVMIREG